MLTDPDRAPVLVLGTLWKDYHDTYTALPGPGAMDPYARVRELLAGRSIAVPDAFDGTALAAARRLAAGGDQLLDAALERGHDRRVAQHLAGAPALLERYHDVSPPARALLDAASDALRLGVGLYLPLEFLAHAVDGPGYLGQDDYDTLAEDWLEQARAELARPVHGNLAPLRRIRHAPDHRPLDSAHASAVAASGLRYRLADYLEQHTRHERRLLCPPASFWHAAHQHLTDPEDLNHLADAAECRQRLQWADALYRRAVDAGNTDALTRLAWLRERVGDREGADALYWRAADAGNTYALCWLAELRRLAGDREGAEALYRRAADAGIADVLLHLAELREQAGDHEGANLGYSAGNVS
ncbi:hypothetical protein [Streptacidiphilus albus]|uniref:hypothetical protein n=1 Tax=Streptacidiphilus albus TaxID=105425 RepID=UPI00068B6934|nr:hypothetical protein [Streptacidiphilus albus]